MIALASQWVAITIADVRNSRTEPQPRVILASKQWRSQRGTGVGAHSKISKKKFRKQNCRIDTTLKFARVTSSSNDVICSDKSYLLATCRNVNADISCTADAAAAELQLWFRQFVAQEAEKNTVDAFRMCDGETLPAIADYGYLARDDVL